MQIATKLGAIGCFVKPFLKVIKFMRRIALALFSYLFFVDAVLAAGAIGTGKIVLVGGQITGQQSIYFSISPVPTDRAACNSNTKYQFVIDPATDGGKALYSAILAARTAGNTVTVKGTGLCGLGQPMETVSYWIVHE